jgi:hypothetical protein
MRPKRTPVIQIDPFLLPTCKACHSRLSLSYIAPPEGSEREHRVFACSTCGLEQEL